MSGPLQSTLCAAAAAILAWVACAGSAPGGARSAVALAPSGEQFFLEIAADDRARALGYMFRASVGSNEGMLFVFDAPGRHGIWMKNCRVALDILWLDARYRVVHMEAGRPPCPPDGPCPSAVPPVAASYVLELAAGSAARAGLRVGDVVVVVWDEGRR